MRILRRNYEHRNLILFLIFSMVYLQAIYSLSQGISIATISSLQSFLNNHFIILGLTAVTIFMVAKLKKHSDKMLLLCLTVITAKNFIMLASSFNKLILGLNFIYLLFAFYFFVTWELEIAKASYNPLFSKNDLEKTTRFHLKGKIEVHNSDLVLDVLITNIDENSCFAMLTDPELKENLPKLSTKSPYKLSAEYEGVSFTHTAMLTSTYDQGLGLDFVAKKPAYNELNWSDLYKVCLERGLF